MSAKTEANGIDARALLTSLIGRDIETMTGRRNRILRVDSETVLVGTNRSPAGRSVPIGWVQDALDRLVEEGELEISVPSVGYRSAFIGAVLMQIPGAAGDIHPRRIRLLDS
jgi:hypothetical protein